MESCYRITGGRLRASVASSRRYQALDIFARCSHVLLNLTSRTVACQVPLSKEFSKQEYWNGLTFPTAGDLPDPGIKPLSPALQADYLPAEPLGKQVVYLPHRKEKLGEKRR